MASQTAGSLANAVNIKDVSDMVSNIKDKMSPAALQNTAQETMEIVSTFVSSGNLGKKHDLMRSPSSTNKDTDDAILVARQAIAEESKRYRLGTAATPWLDARGRRIWSHPRIMAARVIRTNHFEMLMGIVICINIGIIIIESDVGAEIATCAAQYNDEKVAKENCDGGQRVELRVANLTLLVIYTLEAVVRLYVERCTAFHSSWNLLDFFVVFTGWVSELVTLISPDGGFSGFNFLRMCRILRLTRAFRIILSIHELYMLIIGLWSSMKAIFFGMALLMGMLCLWAIVLVEYVHPVNAGIEYENCTRCPEGFATVWNAMVTLYQQLVAGDSWGEINLKVIEQSPVWFFLLMFISVTISLGVMNLILAVIVESAAEARENDWSRKMKRRQKQEEEQKVELLKLSQELDKDFSGTISFDELMDAWDSSESFRAVMALLEIRRDESQTIFNILDVDQSGEVSYKEFVDQLYHVRTFDMRINMAVMHRKLDDMQRRARRNFDSQMTQMNLGFGLDLNEERNEQSSYDPMNARDSGRSRHKVSNSPSMRGESPPRNSNGYDQSGMCSYHTRLLESIDSKLTQVLAGQGQGQGAPGLGPPRHHGHDAHPWTESGPASPKQGRGLEAAALPKQKQALDVLAGISSMHDFMEDLAVKRAHAFRKAEEQHAALLQHAGQLASLSLSVQKERPSWDHTAGAFKSSGAFSQVADERMQEYQRHLRERLAVLVSDIERHIDEEAGCLQSSGRLLEGLAQSLNVKLPATNARAVHNGSAPPSAWRTPRSARGDKPGRRERAGPRPLSACSDLAYVCNLANDSSSEAPNRLVLPK